MNSCPQPVVPPPGSDLRPKFMLEKEQQDAHKVFLFYFIFQNKKLSNK
jgi:hypothetical protein